MLLVDTTTTHCLVVFLCPLHSVPSWWVECGRLRPAGSFSPVSQPALGSPFSFESEKGEYINAKGANAMAHNTQAESADYIQQLIDELGPRRTKRVLEILNPGGDCFQAVMIPPISHLSGLLYRRARNSHLEVMPC